MGEKVARGLNKPVYIYLYGIAFLLFKSAAYFGSFNVFSAINSLFLYCVVTALLFVFFRKIANPAYAGLATVFTWISLLHVTGIAQLFGYPYSFIPASFYVWFYFSVLVFIAVFCIVTQKASAVQMSHFNKVINIFLLMCSVVFLSTGLKKTYDNKIETREHIHTPTEKVSYGNKKDIVWVLMDEYASSASLQQQFGFQDPLDSFLVKEHFVLLSQMHSRYTNTLFSVNSIFNLDDSIPPSSYYQGIDLLRHGSLIPKLEQAGYRFINLGFFDLTQHPMIADRSGYPYTYRQQLFSGTLFSVLYNHWKNTISKSDQYSQQVYTKLKDTLSALSDQPRFIWAHMTIPHQPFCRNQNGDLQKDTAYDGKDSVSIKRKYIGYLQYGNTLLESLINQHQELKQKIVIITGDHGPRYPFLHDRSYQHWPYAAVYIPENFDSTGLKKLSYISQVPGFLLQHLSKSGL